MVMFPRAFLDLRKFVLLVLEITYAPDLSYVNEDRSSRPLLMVKDVRENGTHGLGLGMKKNTRSEASVY